MWINYLNFEKKNWNKTKLFTDQILLKAIQDVAIQNTKLTQDPSTAESRDQEAIRGREAIVDRDQETMVDWDQEKTVDRDQESVKGRKDIVDLNQEAIVDRDHEAIVVRDQEAMVVQNVIEIRKFFDFTKYLIFIISCFKSNCNCKMHN